MRFDNNSTNRYIYTSGIPNDILVIGTSGITLVNDLAYYINMRENETIDYDVVRDVCKEYVAENNINAIL